MKNKILFLVQLPPPVHGASLMNQYVKESKLINELFDCVFFDISPETEHKNVGKFSFIKIIRVLYSYFRIFLLIIKFRPMSCYFTLSPVGFAFYKDVIYVSILKFFRINIIFHLHGKGISDNINSVTDILYKFVFKNADVIHLSEKLFNDIDRYVHCLRNTYTLPNGIPINILNEPRKNSEKIIKILFLSNLIESKGAHVLLDSLSYIPESYANLFDVTIAGGGNYEYVQLLKSKAASFPNFRINFTGPVYSTEKFALLEESDIFVLPTSYKNECFPISILEAMQSGLAICSTDEGAIRELVNITNGYIFDPSKPKELADYLLSFFNDPEHLNNCQKNSKMLFFNKYSFNVFELSLSKILLNSTGQN